MLWVVALNKNQKDAAKGQIKIQGKSTYKTYEAYGFDGSSPEIKSFKKGNIDKDHFDYSIPPLTAMIFVCQGMPPASSAPVPAAK